MSRGRIKTVFSYLRRPWVRASLSLLLIVLILVAARNQLHFIGDGWNELKDADNKWLAVAVVAQGLTMMAQAEVMVVLLRSAGVKLRRLRANALGLAANAVSSTFPGGPAISAAMIFREQLKWGATPVIASWYLVFSGLLSGGGMAILAIGAVFFLGRSVAPTTVTVSIIALIALALLTNWVATHPHQMERWLRNRLRAFNRWRRKPADRFEDKLTGLAEELSAVHLPLPRLALGIFHSLLNWIFEIICLLACIYAVGAEPPIAGVVLSFLFAKLIGQAQVTPGGLGSVELALTTSLVGLAAMTSVHAFASVICFRMISFVGLAIVGWIVFFAAQFSKVAKEGNSMEDGETPVETPTKTATAEPAKTPAADNSSAASSAVRYHH